MNRFSQGNAPNTIVGRINPVSMSSSALPGYTAFSRKLISSVGELVKGEVAQGRPSASEADTQGMINNDLIGLLCSLAKTVQQHPCRKDEAARLIETLHRRGFSIATLLFRALKEKRIVAASPETAESLRALITLDQLPDIEQKYECLMWRATPETLPKDRDQLRKWMACGECPHDSMGRLAKQWNLRNTAFELWGEMLAEDAKAGLQTAPFAIPFAVVCAGLNKNDRAEQIIHHAFRELDFPAMTTSLRTLIHETAEMIGLYLTPPQAAALFSPTIPLLEQWTKQEAHSPAAHQLLTRALVATGQGARALNVHHSASPQLMNSPAFSSYLAIQFWIYRQPREACRLASLDDSQRLVTPHQQLAFILGKAMSGEKALAAHLFDQMTRQQADFVATESAPQSDRKWFWLALACAFLSRPEEVQRYWTHWTVHSKAKENYTSLLERATCSAKENENLGIDF